MDLSLTEDHKEGEHAIFLGNDPGTAGPTDFNSSTWPTGYKVWGFWLKLNSGPLATDDLSITLADSGTWPYINYVRWTFRKEESTTVWDLITEASSGEIGGGSTTGSSPPYTTGWHWLEVEYVNSNTIYFYVDGTKEMEAIDLDVLLEDEINVTIEVPGGKTCPDAILDFMVQADDTQYPPTMGNQYTPQVSERVCVKIYRETELIYDEPASDKNLLSMEVKRNLNEEDSAKVRLDNDELLDIRAGDIIKIWISSGSTIDTKIFNGEITDAVKTREEGEAFLDISATGWAKVLKEHEITQSYPTATNASTIVIGIVADVTDPSQKDYEHLISVEDVETTSKTRTIDFEGVQMFDALKKLGQCTGFDFYVDPDKDLNWFPRMDPGRSSGATLTHEHLQDYDYEEKREICNWAKVFGAPVRTYPDPWELCLLTESINGWSVEGYYDGGTAMSCTIDLDSGFKKCGNYCVSFNPTSVSGTRAEEIIIVSYDFPNTIDLSLKESFTALRFSTILYSLPTSGDNARRESFDVYLIDADGNTMSFPAGSKNINWWQGDFIKESGTSTVVWQDFDIAVGAAEEGDGKWEKLNVDFDWSTVVTIRFRFAVTTRAGTTPDIIYGFIDWLHFAAGRFTGEYKLDDSDESVQTYGRAYAEFYDESAYTTDDCYMQAKYLVTLYKQPIEFLSDVEIDYQEMEQLDPGETVSFSLPESAIPFEMRIIGLTWVWDGDLYGKLDLESSVESTEYLFNGGFELG